MEQMKNIIFYFSGTGNSLQVANDIADNIGECEVLNLAKYDAINPVTAERFGIVFPVYFWGIPNIIKTFLQKIEFEKNIYIFAVVTCGGAAGASLIQVNDLLKSKNQKLQSGFIIPMPENYIVYYNVNSKEKQQKIFENERLKVGIISKVVIDKKEQSLEKSKYIVDMLFGKMVNNAVVKNYPNKDTNFNLNDKCIGCGKCEKVCSVGNITILKGKPAWNHHCEFCLGCLQGCPVEAINYENKTQKRIRYINPNVALD